jgi:Xaa-Pro aminopeptidase
MATHLTTKISDARLIFASSEKDANLLYATGFFAPDAFSFFTCRGESFLVMSDLEIDRARKQARVDHILSQSEVARFIKRKRRGVTDTGEILKYLFSQMKIRTIEVPQDFPIWLADYLRKNGYRLRPSAGEFFEEREIKTRDEIRAIRKAQESAEAGIEVAIEMIRNSRIASSGHLLLEGENLTSERVRQRIAETSLRYGCVATHTIVSCGRQSCDPHEEGHGALLAHRPIILDVFPRSEQTGYWGDITRTVVKGKVSKRLALMYQTVLEGQSIALKEIREGASGRQIHQSIMDLFKTRGFVTGQKNGRMEGFYHGTGHGVGLEIHEPPRISPRAEAPLRAGHIVTIEPGLYYSEIGGIRIEDLVLVTKKGHQNLTRCPKQFEIR